MEILSILGMVALNYGELLRGCVCCFCELNSNETLNFWFVQEEKLPYAFYISDKELLVALGTYLEKNKG